MAMHIGQGDGAGFSLLEDEDENWMVAVGKMGRWVQARASTNFTVGEQVFRTRADSFTGGGLNAFCEKKLRDREIIKETG